MNDIEAVLELHKQTILKLFQKEASKKAKEDGKHFREIDHARAKHQGFHHAAAYRAYRDAQNSANKATDEDEKLRWKNVARQIKKDSRAKARAKATATA